MSRVLTAAIGAPIVVAITLWGPAWSFTLLVAAVAGLAFHEYIGVTGAGISRWLVFPAMGTTASFALGPEWAVTVLGLSLVFGMTVALAGPVGEAQRRLVPFGAGLVYTAALPGFLLLLPRDHVLILIGVVWAGDIGAYYGGRSLGRRPLAPRLSPKKTVEGAVAGILASVIAGFALVAWIGGDGQRDWVTGAFFVLVAAVAQLGDLIESALKRSAGVKDSGTLLPGHGGILDRIDGLILAAPVFYFLWRI